MYGRIFSIFIQQTRLITSETVLPMRPTQLSEEAHGGPCSPRLGLSPWIICSLETGQPGALKCEVASSHITSWLEAGGGIVGGDLLERKGYRRVAVCREG